MRSVLKRMKLYSHDSMIELEDKFVSYSPLLTILRDTDVGVIKVDDAIVIDDVFSLDDIFAYTNLISGNYMHVSRELLEYMGHENPMQYPEEFFSVKVYDNWVRDNFYKYPEILNDPLFGLTEIYLDDIRLQDVLGVFGGTMPNNSYIAGSAAMYIAGVVDDYTDIDVFVTDRRVVDDIKNSIVDVKEILVTTNSITFKRDIPRDARGELHEQFKTREPVHRIPNTKSKYVQVILREYKTPSEIVHGFDLDCCGYILVDNRLYYTVRSKYSTELGYNFFDPTRSSPSYPNRLAKYNLRGFDIWLPFFDRLEFNEEYFNKLANDIYHKHKNAIVDFGESEFIALKPTPFCITQEDIDSIGNYDKALFNFKCNSKMMEAYGFDPIISTMLILYGFNFVKWYMPNDPVSKILLSKFKKIYLSNMTTNDTADYMIMGYSIIGISEEELEKVELEWETFDPMKQLSGTFFPEPIEEDILEWYSKSPYVTVHKL